MYLMRQAIDSLNLLRFERQEQSDVAAETNISVDTVVEALNARLSGYHMAIPSDLAELDSMSPVEHTFKHWGRLDELRADYIRSLIQDALRSDIANAETVKPRKRSA